MGTDFSAERLAMENLSREVEGLVRRVAQSHHRIVITGNGQDIAVMQSAEEHVRMQEQLAFMRAVVEGLVEADDGQGISLQEARNKLGLCK